MKRTKVQSTSSVAVAVTALLAVLYARVSSQDGIKGGYSIPAQLKLLREYALSLGITIVKEFIDVQTTGSPGRAEFGEMLNYLSQHRSVRIVLAEKTDRLYRNIEDRATVKAMDLQLHLVKENQITSRRSRSSDKLAHNIKVAIADCYLDNLSKETRKGMTEKAEEGMWPFRAPIGYSNVEFSRGKRGIVPDPIRADVVRRCFER